MISLRERAQDIVADLPAHSFEAVVHDPPRFSLAGELYSGTFYESLRRVLRRGARVYHYTGMPYTRGRGRRFIRGVAKRLGSAGFSIKWDELTRGFVGKAV